MLRFLRILLDVLVPFGVLLRSSHTLAPFERWPEVLYRILPMSFLVYWAFSFIPLVGGLIYMLVLVPLSIYLQRDESSSPAGQEFARSLLLYLTVILIGFGGIWSFIGHTVLAEMVASSIGWATSPFQTELAFFTLGTGVAALLAIWLRGHLITAVVLSKSIFWYGAAYTHIREAVVHNNFEPSNVGAPLIGDLIYPTLMLYLLWRARGHLEQI